MLKERMLIGIGYKNMDFCVNGDAALTERIAKAALTEGETEEDRLAMQQAFGKADYSYAGIRSMTGHFDALARMRMNKDVTVLMPSNTRFALLKKAIKKLNIPTTRFQEDFNSAAFDAVSVLVEYSIDADKRIKETDRKLKQQEELIEKMMLEQEALRKTVEELKRGC